MSATLGVYLRSYTPISQPQDDVVAAVRALDANDRVDDCKFSEWPATVALSRDCEPVQMYERITEWATRNDVSVDRPFRVHTRHSPLTGTEEHVLHTPVVSVVLFEDDEITGVAPCTLPDGTHLTTRRFLDCLQDQTNPFESQSADALTA